MTKTQRRKLRKAQRQGATQGTQTAETRTPDEYRPLIDLMPDNERVIHLAAETSLAFADMNTRMIRRIDQESRKRNPKPANEIIEAASKFYETVINVGAVKIRIMTVIQLFARAHKAGIRGIDIDDSYHSLTPDRQDEVWCAYFAECFGGALLSMQHPISDSEVRLIPLVAIIENAGADGVLREKVTEYPMLGDKY